MARTPTPPRPDKDSDKTPIDEERLSPEQLQDQSALDAVGDYYRELKQSEQDGAPLAPDVPDPADYLDGPVHGPVHGHYKEWDPPSKLQAPKCPDDKEQRWVRIRIGSEPDTDNLQDAWQHGWRPRPASSVEQDSVEFFSRVEHREFGHVFMRKGLLLMWRPKEVGERWAKYMDYLATQQMAAVDEQMRQSDSRASQYVPSRRTTITVGRKVNVPPD